jgi:hypothetical protein
VSRARRAVRATPAFFEDLDRQLASERGPSGQPSANDFEAFALLRIVERFATDLEGLPELIPGRLDYRVLISTGALVTRLAAVGKLAADGAIELVQLDIDLQWDD